VLVVVEREVDALDEGAFVDLPGDDGGAFLPSLEDRLERIHAELALRFLLPVAADAFRVEDGSDEVFVELALRGVGERGRGRANGKGG